MKNIPVLVVQDDSLAGAYEKALVELYANGTRFKTQYDKPNDPLSIDATMNEIPPQSPAFRHGVRRSNKIQNKRRILA